MLTNTSSRLANPKRLVLTSGPRMEVLLGVTVLLFLSSNIDCFLEAPGTSEFSGLLACGIFRPYLFAPFGFGVHCCMGFGFPSLPCMWWVERHLYSSKRSGFDIILGAQNFWGMFDVLSKLGLNPIVFNLLAHKGKPYKPSQVVVIESWCPLPKMFIQKDVCLELQKAGQRGRIVSR